MVSKKKQRLIVGVSGASGVIYGIRLLQALKDTAIESHLVVSRAVGITLGYESDMSLNDLKGLADVSYATNDIGAAISSGSYRTLGMIVAPCSVKTMSEIAAGTTTNLLTRAADVVLKEHRRLVLMVRETPLHLGHLRTMTQLAEMGAIIQPPVPAFYANPKSLDEMVNHTIGRTLDLFDIDTDLVKRWQESPND